MKKITDIMRDLWRCIITGILLSTVLSIIVGIICLVVYKGDLISIVNGIKTVLICIGAFLMILVAILIMKRNKEKPMENVTQWKDKYRVFSYKAVFLFVAVTILILGGIIDWFLYYKL